MTQNYKKREKRCVLNNQYHLYIAMSGRREIDGSRTINIWTIDGNCQRLNSKISSLPLFVLLNLDMGENYFKI